MSVYLQKTRGNVIILTILEPTMVAERRLPEGKLYTMDTTATDIFYYNQDSQVSKVSTQFLKTLVAKGLTIEGATTSSPLPKQVTDDIANQVVARMWRPIPASRSGSSCM